VRLVLYPLREPSHSGMVSEHLYGVVASLEVRVSDGDVDVAVAWTAQGDRPARVASLELLPALPLRLIFLAQERGRRWWRVRRFSATRLPHSSHLPLGSKLSSLITTPGLYGPRKKCYPPSGAGPPA
jgi:hypothetical protein